MKKVTRKTILKNNAGATATVFAIVAAGAALLAGAAIELTRVNDVKVKLNSIADAAALAGKKAEADTRAETKVARAAGEEAAIKSFNANKHQVDGLAKDIAMTLAWDTDNSLRATVTAKSLMVISGVLSGVMGGATPTYLQAKAVGVAAAGSEQYIEIALVLDNTGSMFEKDGRPETRMTLLRNAAKSFVNTAFDNQTTPDKLFISVIPFGTTVNILGEDPLSWDRSAGSTATVADYGSRNLPKKPIRQRDYILQEESLLKKDFAPVDWRGCISGDGESLTATDAAPLPGFKWKALMVPPNNYYSQWVPYRYVTRTCTACSGGGGGGGGGGGSPPPPPGSTGMDANYSPKNNSKPKFANFTKPFNKIKNVQAGCYNYDCSGDICDWSAPSPVTINCDNMDTKKYYGTDPYSNGRRNTYHSIVQQCLPGSCSPPPGPPYERSQPCVADPNEIEWNKSGGRWCPWVAPTTWTQFDPTTGPNINCPMPMLGLSGSRPQVLSALDLMSPVVGGTHGDVGLRWGLRSLSPSTYWGEFFTAGKKVPRNWKRSNGKKAVIFITDGQNTQANDFPGYWGCSDTNAPGCTGSPDGAELNKRMMDWCTALIDKEVDVYTVAVNISDKTAVDLLAKCAGTPENAFAVDASKLNETLSAVASSIFRLHLKE